MVDVSFTNKFRSADDGGLRCEPTLFIRVFGTAPYGAAVVSADAEHVVHFFPRHFLAVDGIDVNAFRQGGIAVPRLEQGVGNEVHFVQAVFLAGFDKGAPFTGEGPFAAQDIVQFGSRGTR